MVHLSLELLASWLRITNGGWKAVAAGVHCFNAVI